MLKSATKINTLKILGVRVDNISLNEMFEGIKASVTKNEKVIVANVNVHAVMIARAQKWFDKFLEQAEMVFCDGFGVKWAVRLIYGLEIPRFTYVDWFGDFANYCEKNNISIFFLGSKQEIVDKAAKVILERYPQLRIIGTHHGFYNKDIDHDENKVLVSKINQLNPNVLVVGFGMPIQERWINENFSHLNVNIIMPSGAYFDYLSGHLTRPPRWMTDHGLEWLGRLLIEPRRLWKRYLFEIPQFIFLVLKESYTRKYLHK